MKKAFFEQTKHRTLYKTQSGSLRRKSRSPPMPQHQQKYEVRTALQHFYTANSRQTLDNLNQRGGVQRHRSHSASKLFQKAHNISKNETYLPDHHKKYIFNSILALQANNHQLKTLRSSKQQRIENQFEKRQLVMKVLEDMKTQKQSKLQIRSQMKGLNTVSRSPVKSSKNIAADFLGINFSTPINNQYLIADKSPVRSPLADSRIKTQPIDYFFQQKQKQKLLEEEKIAIQRKLRAEVQKQMQKKYAEKLKEQMLLLEQAELKSKIQKNDKPKELKPELKPELKEKEREREKQKNDTKTDKQTKPKSKYDAVDETILDQIDEIKLSPPRQTYLRTEMEEKRSQNLEKSFTKSQSKSKNPPQRPASSQDQKKYLHQKMIKIASNFNLVTQTGQVAAFCSQSLKKSNIDWRNPAVLLYKYCYDYYSFFEQDYIKAQKLSIISKQDLQNYLSQNKIIKETLNKIIKAIDKKGLFKPKIKSIVESDSNQLEVIIPFIYSEIHEFIQKFKNSTQNSDPIVLKCALRIINSVCIIQKVSFNNNIQLITNFQSLNDKQLKALYQTMESKCIDLMSKRK